MLITKKGLRVREEEGAKSKKYSEIDIQQSLKLSR